MRVVGQDFTTYYSIVYCRWDKSNFIKTNSNFNCDKLSLISCCRHQTLYIIHNSLVISELQLGIVDDIGGWTVALRQYYPRATCYHDNKLYITPLSFGH